MDQAKFEKEATAGKDMLLAAFRVGSVVVYNGYFRGTEVIILGHLEGGTRDRFDAKPLAILVTEEVFKDLAVETADRSADDGR